MPNFNTTVSRSVINILTDVLNGKYPVKIDGPSESNLFGDGVSIFLGENRATATTKKNRNIVSMAPRASILIKKKAFSTMLPTNDLQWMDRTERMLLRATKALFAFKVAQIRAYESLSKIEDIFQETGQVNLNLFIDLLDQAQYLSVSSQTASETGSFTEIASLLVGAVGDALAETSYDGLKEDVLKLLERNAFSSDNNLTTWIVDPHSTDNYFTGPGTGVIELGLVKNFETTCSLNSDPEQASIELADPYRIMNISEDDIETAIDEALTGTLGLLNDLFAGDPDTPLLDTQSILGAQMELIGWGKLDSTLDVDYIRDRLRVFYMGKSIINPADGVHIFIRGNKGLVDYSKNDDMFEDDFYQIDETILEAERILYTNKKIDFETFKKLRQFSDNSFAMRHVFAGYITRVSESFGNGEWTLKVDCIDNMGWLTWSRFMIQPALQDPQGILEDPLTPFELKADATGTILAAAGPQLLSENKELLHQGLLSYDSGILNGQVATESNLLQGQYNKLGSLSGTKILQHPQGFVYRWKKGIITASVAINTVDPLNENDVTQKTHNQVYGLTVAEDVLNNLDIANIISLLVVGQPYNVETFVQQAYQVHNISKTSASNLNPTDPLAAVLDVVRRQNNYFGNFRPYRMVTMSNSTIEQTASSSFTRNEINNNIRQLQVRRAHIKNVMLKIDGLGDENGRLIRTGLSRTLSEEQRAIDARIDEQLKVLRSSTGVSSVDIITSNFNLFGQSRTLPLTGNFTADHEITRAMTVVGAQRRIEDVRLNRDFNLLIVSDQYDEHTDIRPYLFKIRDSGYKIFQANYVDIYTKCADSSKFMNLEFFCNPAGHLELRPPQWNRTPLSVLRRLFEIGQETNKKLVPEFLTDIFETRTASLRREIHSLNIRIVLLALLLGQYPDNTLIPNQPNPSDNIYIPEGLPAGKASLRFFGVREQGLKDSSERTLDLRDGKFQTSIGSLVDTGNQLLGGGLTFEAGLGEDGDILNGNTETLLGIFDPIFQEQKNVIQNVLSRASTAGGKSPVEIATAGNLNTLRNEFKRNFGLDPGRDLVGEAGQFQSEDFIQPGGFSSVSDKIDKANKYLVKLEETISNRDRLVTILRRNLEKQEELDEVENILSGEFTSGQGNVIREGVDVTGTITKISRGVGLVDLGGGYNGEINDGQLKGFKVGDKITATIISLNNTNGVFTPIKLSRGPLPGLQDTLERASNTIKTVKDIFSGEASKGSLFDHLVEDDTRNFLGPGSGRRYIIEDHDIISCTFVEQPPDFVRVDVVGDAPVIGSALASTFEDRYYWAGATDFDLWRQYGYKPHEVNLPFANSAELQSKPFAILELQLQRVKINQASITVVGNEYYEPGDVVYLRDKGLLYYVRSVSHSFDIGSSFTTSLVLEFGHPPGVYLPSPLDIIGQQLTKDPLTGTLLVYRNSNGDDKYRVLQPDSAIIFPPHKEITTSNVAELLDYKDNAVRFANMMIDLNTVLIGNRVILIRGFVKGKDDPETEEVKAKIKIIKSLLQNPQMLVRTVRTTPDSGSLASSGSTALSSFGVATGNEKGVEPMILPNGIPANPVPASKIVEQIVTLNKETNTSAIQCLTPTLQQAQELDEVPIGVNDVESVFPKGGPKQRTWLDLRDDLAQVSNIIEIGILDLGRALAAADSTAENKLTLG